MNKINVNNVTTYGLLSIGLNPMSERTNWTPIENIAQPQVKVDFVVPAKMKLTYFCSESSGPMKYRLTVALVHYPSFDFGLDFGYVTRSVLGRR